MNEGRLGNGIRCLAENVSNERAICICEDEICSIKVLKTSRLRTIRRSEAPNVTQR
jgi:hypothetical protein